jgi:hypothetical protein
MSIYAQAVSTGVQALATALDPEGSAAYANAYNTAAARFKASSAKNVAERNISAVRQDKVLTNTKIQLQATQAEAMQRVQNAVAGREGGSVNDVSGEIQKTASQLTQANNKETRQKEESLLAEVNNSHSSLLSIRDQEQSFASGMLEAFSAFEFSDLKLGNDLLGKLTSSKKDGKKT